MDKRPGGIKGKAAFELPDEAQKKYLNHGKEITVALGDTAFNGVLKPSAVMDYCQDVAAEHAAGLGFGYGDLIEKNLAWVLVRMSLIIDKSPKTGETLMIRTFPETPKVMDVNRRYYITDKTGETVVFASSKWCVMDITSQKIKRLASVFEKFPDSDFLPGDPCDDTNPKIQTQADSGFESGRNAGLSAGSVSAFTVQTTDLDRNLHMNNARYGDIILNACDIDMFKENSISRIDLNFVSQLFLGEKYEVYKSHKGNVTFIEAGKQDSSIIFRSMVTWQR